MNDYPKFIAETITAFGGEYHHIDDQQGILILKDLSTFLKTLGSLQKNYEQLLDLTVVDMLHYGQSSWPTTTSLLGYNRASAAYWEKQCSQAFQKGRFSWVAILRSYKFIHILQVQIQIPESLEIPSIVDIWPAANWYEREAYDLFGIVFQNHPDLRRILSDYSFVGHPLRKDFPMIGHEEIRYDANQERCIYEPHDKKQKVTIPKVIRAKGGSHD